MLLEFPHKISFDWTLPVFAIRWLKVKSVQKMAYVATNQIEQNVKNYIQEGKDVEEKKVRVRPIKCLPFKVSA